jgi:hypothetical protein
VHTSACNQTLLPSCVASSTSLARPVLLPYLKHNSINLYFHCIGSTVNIALDSQRVMFTMTSEGTTSSDCLQPGPDVCVRGLVFGLVWSVILFADWNSDRRCCRTGSVSAVHGHGVQSTRTFRAGVFVNVEGWLYIFAAVCVSFYIGCFQGYSTADRIPAWRPQCARVLHCASHPRYIKIHTPIYLWRHVQSLKTCSILTQKKTFVKKRDGRSLTIIF